MATLFLNDKRTGHSGKRAILDLLGAVFLESNQVIIEGITNMSAKSDTNTKIFIAGLPDIGYNGKITPNANGLRFFF